MGKWMAFFEVFQAGKEVANPKIFKMGQAGGNLIGLLILSLAGLAKYYDITIPIDKESALLIGGGIVAIGNCILTMVSSKKIGIGGTNEPERVEPILTKDGNQLPAPLPFHVPTPPPPPARVVREDPRPSWIRNNNAIIPNVEIDQPMQPTSKTVVERPADPTKSLYFGD